MTEAFKMHPFELTLGPGPYRYVGFGKIQVSETFGARYDGPEVERGAGTCAHCGMGIMNIYVVETSENKRFGVGSDCIMKAGMEAKELSKVERAVRDHKAQGRAALKLKKGEAA